jgi:hypothetical protein
MSKDKDVDTAIAEFLAKGGVIQKAAYRESGRVEGAAYTSPWGAKKAGRPPAADIDPTIEVEDEE